MSLYEPLYPPAGAPCRAFYCCICQSVMRTERGVKLHLLRKHKLKLQMDLKFD